MESRCTSGLTAAGSNAGAADRLQPAAKQPG